MSGRRIFSTKMPNGKEAELYGRDVGDAEIHVDGAWGFTFTNGTCKVNLFTVTPSSDPEIERREVAARITMIAPTLFAMRDFFIEQCRIVEERFLITQEEESAGERGEENQER